MCFQYISQACNLIFYFYFKFFSVIFITSVNFIGLFEQIFKTSKLGRFLSAINLFKIIITSFIKVKSL